MFAAVRGWKRGLLQLVLPVPALAALAMFANVGSGLHGDPMQAPPYEPFEALATLEVVESFHVETFAAEPLIADPVDMDGGTRPAAFMSWKCRGILSIPVVRVA